jgi:[acyl-carrier-protein] S-malonyltransferase
MDACKARGAKRAVALPVSAPFHSSLLAPAAARLRERLAGVNLQPPRIPVVHNVDVSVHTTTEGMRDALVRQADHPVRWVECIQAMAARGATLVCECGPGKVLAPLVKRTVEGAEGRALVDRAAIEQAIATLKGA